MPGQNDPEILFPVQGIEKVDRHTARIGKKCIHALLDERLHKKLCTFDLHLSDLPQDIKRIK